ncbi:hypothetical protein KAFR_0A07700 [Kazachstania africana CBS 2517]|uniref:RRM domain-containing protein n=1 Tax=Kazachstania africana (strain ATCC 22294 / BCRC 22015 / CBS 2517 / CECT 1963 / NBRC 1671 / NRRL Y-8276) TaxID=1071382 RepID=H2APA4_KAZAF|nr:hypothetical protein KAFR_0A07700 [Kazachstania africana CBS 2517]CCF56204.1 hypothetical protein KAFR_0A07700 [Kazachstania africana CBS 2517]
MNVGSNVHSAPAPAEVLASQNNSELNINEKSSPLHFTAMLNNLSISGNVPLQPLEFNQDGTYILKISNIPDDLTLREAYTIFALSNGAAGIELLENSTLNDDKNLNDRHIISAKFNSLNLVVQYANILNSKNELFGPTFPFKSHIEVTEEPSRKQVPYQTINLNYNSLNPLQQLSIHTPINNGMNQSQASPVPSSNKRPSLLTQRSRFSFSDPFANNLDGNNEDPNMTANNDISKSFLLMENDEINDNIWGPNVMASSSMKGLMDQIHPATPSLEWRSNNNGRKSSSFFLPSTAGSAVTPTLPDVDMMQMSGTNNNASIPSYAAMLNQMDPSLGAGQQSLQQMMNQGSNEVNVNTTPQKDAYYNSMQNLPTNTTPHSKSRLNSSVNRNTQSSAGTTTSTNNIVNKSSSSLANNAGGISQADLSLLARVPPPANPADQNPPCNTLYVGNLPPDATEQELRQLFSKQQGFRRLSFKNKSSNGNGHGPMCFVEFDDVSFATRALAELYGSQLPRTTTSNKGGIRLSFSKNPLGVRGPNSRRSNNSNGSNANISNSNVSSSSNINYNYVTGFTKN